MSHVRSHVPSLTVGSPGPIHDLLTVFHVPTSGSRSACIGPGFAYFIISAIAASCAALALSAAAAAAAVAAAWFFAASFFGASAANAGGPASRNIKTAGGSQWIG